MRRSLVTADASGFLPHDHVAWSGSGPASLVALAGAAFTQAAFRGEKLMFIVGEADTHRLAALPGAAELVAAGTLDIQPTGAAYSGDTDAQRDTFEGLLDQALSQGYTGLCVVADNSSAASGSDDDFAAWLEWEAIADRMQSELPINGICYFDAGQVSAQRLADIAALHPVVNVALTHRFCLTFDGAVVRVAGAIEPFDQAQIRRLLHAAPELTRCIIDIAHAEFVDYRFLCALHDAAKPDQPIQVRGALPALRRVWDTLDVKEPAVAFYD